LESLLKVLFDEKVTLCCDFFWCRTTPPSRFV
jgi:hypothetical protein